MSAVWTNISFNSLAPPSAPTITSLISTYSDQLTVTWTSVPTATSYNVSINDSVNTLVPIPSTGAPQYTFTGLTNNTVYTVSVVAINCAGSSSPATITGRTGETKVWCLVWGIQVIPTGAIYTIELLTIDNQRTSVKRCLCPVIHH